MARARSSRPPAKSTGKKARTTRKSASATATEPATPGRPSLVSDTPEWKAKRKKLLSELKQGTTERCAVMVAGIGWSTYMLAKKIGRSNDPDSQAYRDFLDQCIQAMAQSRAKLEKKVHKGDAKLALRVLRSRYPRDWNPELITRVMAILGGEDEDPTRPVPTVAVRREQQLLDAGDELDDFDGDVSA